MLNLYELANLIDEPLRVSVRHKRFVVQFLGCEVKESRESCVIGSEWGVGDTIDEAADDYFRRINGKWLVFGYGESRREYAAEIAKHP